MEDTPKPRNKLIGVRVNAEIEKRVTSDARRRKRSKSYITSEIIENYYLSQEQIDSESRKAS